MQHSYLRIAALRNAASALSSLQSLAIDLSYLGLRADESSIYYLAFFWILYYCNKQNQTVLREKVLQNREKKLSTINGTSLGKEVEEIGSM